MRLTTSVNCTFAQMPFTVEKMQALCRYTQKDFITAMKAYPNFKENVENRTETKCDFSRSSDGMALSHKINKENKETEVALFSLSLTGDEVKIFIDDLKSKGYTEYLPDSEMVKKLGMVEYRIKGFDVFLKPSGHGLISIRTKQPPVAYEAPQISGKIIEDMDIDKIKDAIANGLNINDYLYSPSNYRPLETAIEMEEVEYFDNPEKIKKHLELIKFLLDIGADVNQKSNWGKTPLYTSCEHKIYLENYEAALSFYDQVVELLLNKGADPNILEEGGNSPLIQAVYYQRLAQVKSLLTHGANKTYENKSKYGTFSPLRAAKDNLKRAKTKEQKETALAILNLVQ